MIGERHYEFMGMVIPDHTMAGLIGYVENGLLPGGFLQAVICNDLSEAVGRADHKNIRNIPAIVSWLYNEAPSSCWGSAEKMNAWLVRFVKPMDTTESEKP